MNYLKEILDHNKAFTQHQAKVKGNNKLSKQPDKQVAILSCMDTRLVSFLEDALGQSRGNCILLKNAGAIVSHPFGGVMRSLVIAIYELNVSEIVVIGHKDCGMANIVPERIEQKMIDAGVSPDILRGIESTGMNLHEWYGGFDDCVANVRETTEKIRLHPLIPDTFPIHGLVIDPETGELELVVDGYDQLNLPSYEEYRQKKYLQKL